MAITYQNVIDGAREMLRDTQGAKWSDSLMLELVNDGVALVRKSLEKIAPEMFWKKQNITIQNESAGPYDLPADFNINLHFYNDFGQELSREYKRNDYLASAHVGRPEAYALEGIGPGKIYFDKKPASGESYIYVLFYLPKLDRQTDANQNIPLPDETYPVLKEWTTKIAGIVDEYNTMDEDQKMSLMLPLLQNTALARANEIEFEIEEFLW